MDNKTESILKKVIDRQLNKDDINLDAIEIVDILFSNLNEREQNIIKRRFGLNGQKKETLEEIGKNHGLTRERVRQIENSGINKIKKLETINEIVVHLRNIVEELLKEHGGMAEKEYLLDVLENLSTDFYKEKVDDNRRNHFNFLITKILDQDFEEVSNSKNFSNFLKIKDLDLSHLELIAEELLKKIREAKKLFVTNELIDFVKDLDSFKTNKDKINIDSELDLANLLKNLETDLLLTNAEDKAIYSLIQAVNDVIKNKFGQWGHREWRDVKPRTINDKIYLILKNNGQPMYYGDIAKKIAEMDFDKKNVNVATTHNELILDEKYVLVGRGIYALKEWGYKSGTVSEIIEDILKTSQEALSKEVIIKKVSEQRTVKPTTINLALMNKQKFEKVGNKYKLK